MQRVEDSVWRDGGLAAGREEASGCAAAATPPTSSQGPCARSSSERPVSLCLSNLHAGARSTNKPVDQLCGRPQERARRQARALHPGVPGLKDRSQPRRLVRDLQALAVGPEEERAHAIPSLLPPGPLSAVRSGLGPGDQGRGAGGGGTSGLRWSFDMPHRCSLLQ